jgi:SET domain-containing protein
MKKENKKELLIKSFSNVYCRLRPSKYGIGVFAIRDIPKGTNPFVGCYSGDFIPVGPEEIENQPESIKEMIKDFCPLQEGKYWIIEKGLNAIDISFYLNHSENPNMIATEEGEWFVAKRDIKAGEELTVDYNTYDDVGLN